MWFHVLLNSYILPLQKRQTRAKKVWGRCNIISVHVCAPEYKRATTTKRHCRDRQALDVQRQRRLPICRCNKTARFQVTERREAKDCILYLVHDISRQQEASLPWSEFQTGGTPGVNVPPSRKLFNEWPSGRQKVTKWSKAWSSLEVVLDSLLIFELTTFRFLIFQQLPKNASFHSVR